MVESLIMNLLGNLTREQQEMLHQIRKEIYEQYLEMKLFTNNNYNFNYRLQIIYCIFILHHQLSNAFSRSFLLVIIIIVVSVATAIRDNSFIDDVLQD